MKHSENMPEKIYSEMRFLAVVPIIGILFGMLAIVKGYSNSMKGKIRSAIIGFIGIASTVLYILSGHYAIKQYYDEIMRRETVQQTLFNSIKMITAHQFFIGLVVVGVIIAFINYLNIYSKFRNRVTYCIKGILFGILLWLIVGNYLVIYANFGSIGGVEFLPSGEAGFGIIYLHLISIIIYILGGFFLYGFKIYEKST